MSHFTPAFFKFFDQLGKNNHKEWFDANRPTYEKEVKEPFKKFVSIIISELAKDQPDLLKDASKSIFRINRDIRFAKDKSPYKNHVGAFFSRSGTKDTRPGYYLHIGAKEMMLGGGVYEVDKEKLEKIRQEIYYNNDAFKKIINEKNFKGYYGVVKGEQNKILTPDYKEDVLSKDFDKLVLKHYKAAARFNDFMMQAMTD
jgi:uncharacterized protein (TIGR02453 family)